MPTSMHYPLIHALQILHTLRTRIRQPRPLLHGERIDICAQQKRLTRSIFQHSGDAVATNGGMNSVCIERLQVLDN